MTPEQFLERYRTRCFFHFTDSRNLDSIRQVGGLLRFACSAEHSEVRDSIAVAVPNEVQPIRRGCAAFSEFNPMQDRSVLAGKEVGLRIEADE